MSLTAEEGSRIGAASGGEVLATATATGRVQEVSFDLPDGRHRLEVTARDGAGNVSAAVTRTVTVDSTPPEPPDVRVDVGGRADPETVVHVGGEAGALYELELSGPQRLRADGRLGAGGVDEEFLLPNGRYTASVVLQDAAGNRSEEVITPFVVAVDAPEAPTLKLTSEPGSSLIEAEIAGQAGLDVVVVLTAPGEEERAELTLDIGGVAAVAFDATDGTHTLRAHATDYQGQVSDAVTVEAVVKTGGPSVHVTIDDPALREGRLAYELVADEGADVRVTGNHPALATTFVATAEAFDFDAPVEPGSYTLVATAVDAFGNETVLEVDFEVLTPASASDVVVGLLLLGSPFALLAWQRRRIGRWLSALRRRPGGDMAGRGW